ncbi:MAG: NUDIX hydrolase [Megasphaera sp.]|uniref:NUDIX hydrolase n=2 Tax=Megasphaera sp. TaxID=2023260 RepID=UPI0025C2409E|nr:NUDIX hydrolase [Megasphaera sp.]MCF0152857.1 NUDIX hydrolase [Megasphaera sp.]MCI7599982.1 NUDIX hydrolase [Megasphaera sp.]
MAQEANVLMGLSVKAMIFHDGKLLLLQKNDAEGVHHWEFPGGGLRFTEDFEAGLRREVREETGLSITLEAPVGIWSYQKKDGQFLNGVIFVATTTSDNIKLSDEHLAYHWVTPEELPSYRLHGSLQRSLTQMKRFSYEKSHVLLRDFLSAI